MQHSHTEALFLPYLVSLETLQSHKCSLPQNFQGKFMLHVTSRSTSLIFFLPILSLFPLVPPLITGDLAAPRRDLRWYHVSRASHHWELST